MNDKVRLTRIWLDGEQLYRSRIAISLNDITYLEEYIHDNFDEYTDSNLTWVEVQNLRFLIEKDFNVLYKLWKDTINLPIN